MKVNKTILKTLGFIILALPIVYAGECKELEEYFKGIENVEIPVSYYSNYSQLNCKENSDGKVIELTISENNGMTEKIMDKILSYDTITTLNYKKELEGYKYEFAEKNEIPNNIDKLTNLKKLKNLETLYIEFDCSIPGGIGYYLSLEYGNIINNTLKDLTSLKHLILHRVYISQNNIEEISTLTNLESLIISKSSLNEKNNYKSLSKLENVKYLEIDNIPQELVNTIKSVKELVLNDNSSENKLMIDDLPNVEKISWYIEQKDVSSLGKLDKLEELELNFESYGDLSSLEKINQIKKLIIRKDRIIPGAAGNPPESVTLKFSEDSQLKELSIASVLLSDSNVKEILKLKNLEKLSFSQIDVDELSEEGVKLLKSLESRCSLQVDYDFYYHREHEINEFKSFKNGPCNQNINTSIIDTLPITTNVEKDAITSTITKTITKTTMIVEPTTSAPDNESLIDDNKINKSDVKVEDKTNESDVEVDEKIIDKSIESEEEPVENIKISTNYKCGKTDGKCPKGECCSKYGWCGKSDRHCLVSKGCQSEFGKCKKDEKISTNYRCGKTNGKCPNGECCSKYGWCGKSDRHCLISEGCQSEFGRCQMDEKISTNYRCGKTDGKCPKGECCSKYGWCGISDRHCLVSKGCQSEFGKCK